MDNPIYADFNNVDEQGRVRLNNDGTLADLKRRLMSLGVGQKLMISDGEIKTEGAVEFSKDEEIWVLRVDWKTTTDSDLQGTMILPDIIKARKIAELKTVATEMIEGRMHLVEGARKINGLRFESDEPEHEVSTQLLHLRTIRKSFHLEICEQNTSLII